MAESMVLCRQTWCWGGSREFYIQICGQQKERITLGLASASEASKPATSDTLPLTGLHFLIVLLLWTYVGHFFSNHHMTSEYKESCKHIPKTSQDINVRSHGIPAPLMPKQHALGSNWKAGHLTDSGKLLLHFRQTNDIIRCASKQQHPPAVWKTGQRGLC